MVIGGAIGTYIALKIEMTALPQLVAAFHSLVGLAAVCVAAAAFAAPQSYGIGTPGAIPGGSLAEMGLGTAIGAITFTGSIVAFAKLQGLVSGKPLVFTGQHLFNAALGVALIAVLAWFIATEATAAFVLLVLISLPFFHFAHRLRYLLVDLGVPAAKSFPAQVVFYGGAILVTLVTIWVLLTTAPISLG